MKLAKKQSLQRKCKNQKALADRTVHRACRGWEEERPGAGVAWRKRHVRLVHQRTDRVKKCLHPQGPQTPGVKGRQLRKIADACKPMDDLLGPVSCPRGLGTNTAQCGWTDAATAESSQGAQRVGADRAEVSTVAARSLGFRSPLQSEPIAGPRRQPLPRSRFGQGHGLRARSRFEHPSFAGDGRPDHTALPSKRLPVGPCIFARARNP